MYALRTESKDIGEKTFTVSLLPLAEARKLFFLVRSVLEFDPEDVRKKLGLSPSFVGAVAGRLDDETIRKAVELLGPKTMVRIGDREFPLKEDAKLNEVFAGAIDEMFEWIDFGIEVNFRKALEKMRGASAQPGAEAPTPTTPATSPRT